jgi:hypothetical protein
MTDLTLVVVGKDWDSLRGFDLSNVDCAELVLLANAPIRPMAEIGNYYLQRAKTAVLGLVHADTVFRAGGLAAIAGAAALGAVCGIVGVTESPSFYRWCYEKPGSVETLDSCSVFLRRDLGLWFDAETFDGLHCHVEDICMSAHAQGTPVIVPFAQATHCGKSGNNAPWRAQYQIYRDRLTTKWDRAIVTT